MKVDAALATISKLAIDTSPFIYWVEKDKRYVDRVRAIFTKIAAGAIQSFTSTVTLTEVLTFPLKTGDTSVVNAFRNTLIYSGEVSLIPISSAIAERAAELRARYNLKTPDALQVAVAVHQQCDAFLTNDLGLKRVTEVQILVLDDLTV